ncbi:hypothetical protein BaRGS_00007715 [Batillaria attramentaria]|uniref:Lengsin n=1 Tax=Batillaria attramentaria TaxID=370345 RepID=A0ABD0LNY1_9CAEN
MTTKQQVDQPQTEMARLEAELSKFDFVQFTIPDINGIPKGRLVPADMISQACRDGVGAYIGTGWFGVRAELPSMIPEYAMFSSGYLHPLPSTCRPLAWCSAPNRRIGHVMCQMKVKGEILEACPRRAAQRQLDRLHKMGLKMKSAFEMEFMVFDSKTMEPLGGKVFPYANMEILDRNLEFYTDMHRVLLESGVSMEYLFPEYEPGQFEVSMKPVFGLESVDNAFLFRYGVRAFSNRRGYTTTFMGRPFYDYNTSGLHFNHSLWTKDDQDVFFDASDPLKLSGLARHWIAGLLEHAPAIAALACPTVNCYHRLHEGFAPGKIYWNEDDRLCTFRAKTSQTGAYLENRIPSSACNPYLVLAATIAAGLDGVERKLACPPPGPSGKSEPNGLPRSLGEALDFLEKDVALKSSLGSKLIEDYIAIKREFEVKQIESCTSGDMSKAERIVKEREYYMPMM